MKEKKRLEKCYSITGAAKLLGISRYAIAYAIEKKYINVILVPTAGLPRREIALRELEKLALRYDCSAPLRCHCSTCRTLL